MSSVQPSASRHDLHALGVASAQARYGFFGPASALA